MNQEMNSAPAGRVLRLLIVAVALVLAFTVGPWLALAHAELTSSTPADGATVQPGLTEITLIFSEEISVDDSTADLEGPGGAMMQGVSVSVDRAERTKMTLKTPALGEGKYTVKWKSVTEDDNGVTNGSFSFTVSGGGTTQGGTTTVTSGDTSRQDLPTTGAGFDTAPLALGVALALVLLGAGVAMRRRAHN
jgi:methionine-rich copper-binding protein CopC